MKVQFQKKRDGLIAAATIVSVAFLTPIEGYAQFGGIVHDPINAVALGHIWSQDISNYAKLIETITRLEKIYANGMQMYQLGTAMSHSFSGAHKADWIAVAQMGVDDYTRDRYGESRTWSGAVNGNPSNVPVAWQLSTVALGEAAHLSTEQPGQSGALARLASVEAMDGSATKCLQTISQYRGNSLANQLGPILKLAIARADGTAATNSHIEQMNILAAEHEQGNTEARAQGAINACLVEQQILTNKVTRDNQAEAINLFAKVSSLYASNPTMLKGMASTMRADIQ